MKKFNLLFILGSFTCGMYAQAESINSNIRIFNETSLPKYYLITDNTFKDYKKTGEVLPNGSVIPLDGTEDHSAGRIYIAEKPFPTSINAAPPIGGHYTLIEYTIPKDSNITDYDFSAVDSLDTIPVTLEAAANSNSSSSLGWVGNGNQTEESLEQAVNDFSTSFGWPTFIFDKQQPQNAAKIPGAYNLFAIPQNQLSGSALAMRDKLKDRWKFWTTGTPEKICSDSTVVGPLDPQHHTYEECISFAKDIQFINGKYNILEGDNLAGLYGYVSPYNFEGSPYAPYVIAVLRGVSTEYDPDQIKKFLYPPYDSPYSLDPYVTFIHKTLSLQVYAFSIDDSIGNIFEPSRKDLYVDIGGTKYLPNKNPYQPGGGGGSSNFHVNWAPNWEGTTLNIGKSVSKEITDNSPGSIGFDVDDSEPDLITFSLKNQNKNFNMILKKDSQDNLTKTNCFYNGSLDASCNNFATDLLGAQINIDNKNHTIDLPPGK